MATTSSKIKKQIKGITFKRNVTVITFKEKFIPRDHQEVIEERIPKESTMKRHPKFDRAMERLKVHLVVRLGFASAVDRLGKPIEKSYFDDCIFEDDERFKNVTVTGIVITTVQDETIFKINGFITTEDGEVSKLTSPKINLLKQPEGYNYELQDLAKDHLEAVLIEAEGYLNYKTDQMTIPFDNQGKETKAA